MATAIQKITSLGVRRDIPFNKLVLSQANVRRVKQGVSIDTLAESIARRGLLQNLNVRPVLDEAGAETGMFKVPAGGRRFRALEQLVRAKRLAKTFPIPCNVRDADSPISEEEDSLSENTDRDRAAGLPGARDRQQRPRAAALRRGDQDVGSDPMSEKLRLGPLPKAETVRLTVTLPAAVKTDLDRYAELYAAAYGEPVDAVALIPHMLATFMERDRAFRKAIQVVGSTGTLKKEPLSRSPAISSTSETTDDCSSSR